MPRIRALSFDLDDTLWPIAPVIESAELQLRHWLTHHCPEVTVAYSIEQMREQRERVWERHPELSHDFTTTRIMSLRELLTPFGYGEMHVEAAFECFFRARNQVTLYQDVLPSLQSLSQEYRLIAISNGNADLRRIGISHFFEFSLHAREHGKPKPAPCIFQAALKRLGLNADAVAHIGDHGEQDVDAAHAVGMHAFWLKRHNEALAPRCNHIPLQSLVELPAALAVIATR
jgi:putative hydrolase of the HAD superfamily